MNVNSYHAVPTEYNVKCLDATERKSRGKRVTYSVRGCSLELINLIKSEL